MFVHTLGDASIDVGELTIGPGAPLKFALLLHLWAERGKPVSRSRLRELIFPRKKEGQAQHSLRQMVYQFRQLGVRFASDDDGIRLLMDGVGSDFAEVVAAKRLSVEQCRAAERGFLPDFAPDHSDTYIAWLDGYRARVTFELGKLFVAELLRSRAVGDWAMTERAARGCLGLEPLHEEATLALAESLAMGGAKSKALALLDEYVSEIGRGSMDLRIPAELLRRRIRERLPDGYRPHSPLPFLGRDPEMLTLRERFRNMQRGETHCVVIGGAAGIGKTCLTHEFLSMAALDGARVERTVSRPQDAHRPLGALLEIVPGLLRLPGALGTDPESLTLLRQLTTFSRDAKHLISTEATVGAQRFATSKAIADLVDAIAAESPLVLAFDDAHWIDGFSASGIAAMLTLARPRRLLILILTREPQRLAPAFRHAGRTSTIRLAGLDVATLAPLVARMIGGDEATRSESGRRVAARSGGNPSYALQLAAGIGTATAPSIPQPLRDLLEQRLDGVSPGALAFLQSCAALGRHATVDRVSRSLDARHSELLACMSELSDASLIESTGTEIHPSSPLVVEVLRDRAQPAWLTLVNRAVAKVLEDDAEVEPSLALWSDCAERWLDSFDDDRAVRAFAAGARHAHLVGRPDEAMRILERASEVEGRRRGGTGPTA